MATEREIFLLLFGRNLGRAVRILVSSSRSRVHQLSRETRNAASIPTSVSLASSSKKSLHIDLKTMNIEGV